MQMVTGNLTWPNVSLILYVNLSFYLNFILLSFFSFQEQCNAHLQFLWKWSVKLMVSQQVDKVKA